MYDRSAVDARFWSEWGTMLKTFGLSAALGFAAMVMAYGTADAATCKTLSGKMVGFGVESVRSYAEKALDQEIAAWEHRASFIAKPKDRKTNCKIYIEWLNEFECTAQAVVCR